MEYWHTMTLSMNFIFCLTLENVLFVELTNRMSQRTTMRNKSFLDTSLRLDGITAILETVKDERHYFTEVYRLSKIQMKQSFLKYLHFCKQQEFVTRTPGINQDNHRGQNQHVMFYNITDNGRMFLELLS